eukprot:10158742-Prorocentrum_lima.AAC.1
MEEAITGWSAANPSSCKEGYSDWCCLACKEDYFLHRGECKKCQSIGEAKAMAHWNRRSSPA